jgi:hypothetical protein
LSHPAAAEAAAAVSYKRINEERKSPAERSSEGARLVTPKREKESQFWFRGIHVTSKREKKKKKEETTKPTYQLSVDVSPG